jgi:hypothetical protein
MITITITGSTDDVITELEELYLHYGNAKVKVGHPSPEYAEAKEKLVKAVEEAPVSCPTPPPRSTEDYEEVAPEVVDPVFADEIPELPLPLPQVEIIDTVDIEVSQVPTPVPPPPTPEAPVAPPPPPPAPESTKQPKTQSPDGFWPRKVGNEYLDKEGYPWDKRINPKSRLTLAKTGCWKLIRRVEQDNPGIIERVRNEQHAKGYPKGLDGKKKEDPKPAPKDMDFNAILRSIVDKVNLGQLSQTVVDSYLESLGIPEPRMAMMGTKAELFPKIIEYFGLC